MAQGSLPEQEAVDDVRHEARIEALTAICDLEQFVRADEGDGGMDAIRLGVLSQQVTEKVRVYRMTVNVGDQPAERTRLAEAEATPRGLGRRRADPRHTRSPSLVTMLTHRSGAGVQSTNGRGSRW